MMKKNKTRAFLVIVSILVLQACAIFKLPQKEANTKLPSNYEDFQRDTSNTAKLSWQDFFEDPYLLNLIDSALINNKELNITLQKINMANNEILLRKGEYLPFVNGQVAADGEKVGKYTRNGAVEENLAIKDGIENPKFLGNFQLGLSASWELDVWKKLRNAKNAAILEYMASVEGKNFLMTNLIAEVANSYYELLALDNQLKNLEENISIQQNALAMVKLLLQSARVNSLAVNRFEAEVRKNQSEIFNIQQDIFEVETRINFLCGKSSSKVDRNAESFIDLSPKLIAYGLPSDLLENRPDIRMAEQELEAAKLNIKVAKAKFFPSFGINAGIGFQAFNPKFLFNSPASILGSVAGEMLAPLVNRNAIKAEYKNANSKQIQAAFEYEQAIINGYREVVIQISKINNMQKNYELKKQQVELLTQSIEIANDLFQSARADYMEVLLTQRDALEAKMNLIASKKEQMKASIDLYRALGGGWQ
ncbi:MAG: TolC family protein [Chitinophagales bacterium]